MGDSISSVVETPDLAVIGISAAAEVSLALVVLHVVANRRHPAYFAKNYGLILYTALAVSRDRSSLIFALGTYVGGRNAIYVSRYVGT